MTQYARHTPRPPTRRQHGFALLELLGALAVGALVLLGLSTAMDTSLADLKGQQAGYYQSQLVAGADKYISANADALQLATPTAATIVPVTLAQLKAGRFVPPGLAAVNAYGQSPCVLVRQSDPVGHPGQFDTLVTTVGGDKIADREIAVVAAGAGTGGGYISAASPAIARGTSWSIDTTPYRGTACAGAGALTGGAADGGHLASNLFYGGPGQLSTDFLYRGAVPGHPELNRMNTPLRLANAALVAPGASCLTSAGVAEAGLAIDAATRAVLTCGAGGTWSLPSQWKDPVAAYADLPAAGSTTGDVRMVTTLSRAFTWDGAKWAALAVDQNGDLDVPGTATAAQLVAANSVYSKGTIRADGDINSGNDIAAQHDVNASHDLRATHNVYAGRDMFADGGVSGQLWMYSNHISLFQHFNPGDACNFQVFNVEDGVYYIPFPIGTIVLDANSLSMTCYADETFRYANGTYRP
jgi:hypothetical protein